MGDTIMNSLNRFLFLMLIIFGLFLFSFAKEKPSKIEKLSKGADIILTGKVTQKISKWNENKTRIYTKATLKVDEFLKGNNNGSSVEVVYPGGEIDEVGEIYTHMPKFNDNEEVLGFLKKDRKQKEFKVLHGEEGKITVIRDSKTNEKMTRSNVHINALKSQIKSIVNEQK